MRNLEDFNNKYVGEKCVIAGSGTSLSSVLTDKKLVDRIKQYPIISVNSGYVGFPDSDYFVSDDWAVAQWSYFFHSLRTSKKTIPLLYEDKFPSCSGFEDRVVYFRHRKGYHLTDYYDHDDYENRICQARSSVGSAIHIAYIMGFKEIVLLGIDCCRHNAYRYFWQTKVKDPPWKKPFRKDNITLDGYRRCVFNKFQADTDLVDIFQYWEQVGPLINEKVKIYNASPLSRLKVFEKVLIDKVL